MLSIKFSVRRNFHFVLLRYLNEYACIQMKKSHYYRVIAKSSMQISEQIPHLV